MSMPTPRRGKSSEIPVQRHASLRKSSRKKKATEVPVKTPKGGLTKTPKRIRRKSIKFDNISKVSKSKNSDCFSSPNILGTRTGDRTCSFYRQTMGPNGRQFSPSLLKYFLKIDSPEVEDLRNKRFNTSFCRERKTNRDSLKIFTDEELKDETRWHRNMPNIVSSLPDVPGSEHTDVFASLPSIDFDFKQGTSTRKSVRCTAYKGKPLPDEHLLFDYSPAFCSETKWEEVESSQEEKVVVENISDSMMQDINDNLLLTKEDESKYKDILKKEVSVVVTKLPIEPCKEPCEVKSNSQDLTLE